MEENQFNPADIADILGSIARGLFPLRTQRFGKPSSHWTDVRDPLVVVYGEGCGGAEAARTDATSL